MLFKITLPIVGAILLLASCSKRDYIQENNAINTNIGKISLPIIELSTRNYVPEGIGVVKFAENSSENLANNDINKLKKANTELRDSLWGNDFGKTILGTSDQISISQTGLLQKAFIGSLINGNSISNLSYSTLATYQNKVKPLKVSVSFPAKRVSGTINSATLSGTREFIADIMNNNQLGNQISSYSYSIERFTAYDELKLAFGSNVNTKALFYKKTTTTSGEENRISRRSGIYVRFIQKNFSLDADLPSDGVLMDPSTNMVELNKQNPTYVSSVTYGRMGIMSIESDSSYEKTYEAFNKAYKALFVSGSSSLTQEEIQIIDQADMRLFLVGTGGNATVNAVQGYDGFLKVAAEGGSFSAQQPGVPIYFSLSGVNGNALVIQNFKVDVFTDPIYARLEYDNVRDVKDKWSRENNWGEMITKKANISVKMYSDPLMTNPTIPPSYVKFNYRVTKQYESSSSGDPYNYQPPITNTTIQNASFYNAFRQSYYSLGNEISINSTRTDNRQYMEDTYLVNITSEDINSQLYELLPGNYYKVMSTKK